MSNPLNENIIIKRKNLINKIRSLDGSKSFIGDIIDQILNGTNNTISEEEETNATLGTNEAGTNEAGTNEAGTNEAGTSEAGTSEAGGTSVAGGTSEAGTSVAGGTSEAGGTNATNSQNITIITGSQILTIITGSEDITSTTSSEDVTPKTSSEDIETNNIITTSETSSSENSTLIVNTRSKSSGGLSTGAICGIVIPCVAALIGVAAAVALCKAGTPTVHVFTPSIPTYNYIDTSLDKFNVVPVQQPVQPVQPVQIITPEPQPLVQPQIIEPEPPRPIIRPNYPVTAKLDPPVVNRGFQPMYPAHQGPIAHAKGVKMMPVQELQMVPIQKVDMVPVHEVVPDMPVHGIVPPPHIVGVNQAVPFQQIVPMQHIVPLHAGTEIASEVPQVSQIPGISALLPQVNPIGTGLISQPQIIPEKVQISQLPSQVIPGTEVFPAEILP